MYSNIKFYRNPSGGSRSCFKRTDGRDEANSPFFAVLRTSLRSMKNIALFLNITFEIMTSLLSFNSRERERHRLITAVSI